MRLLILLFLATVLLVVPFGCGDEDLEFPGGEPTETPTDTQTPTPTGTQTQTPSTPTVTPTP